MASIHKLSSDVINRIAAGEVVQRPSAALKELLENAIDAECSRVQVLAADGGLEALQVSDDGTGIHKEDLPLLCERYATSKLQSFDDLHRVTSFGFRGEALASVSYVSRVTVTTRRRPLTSTTAPLTPTASSSGAQVAWRAQYLNGRLVADPQPCAGNPGTTIRAEKLFYNALVRRNSLRASEEWGRIVDVVSRYALAYPQIGFTCQRDQGYGSGNGVSGAASGGSGSGGGGGGAQGGGGVNFPPNSTTRQNIRLSHGNHVASHLRLIYAYEVGVMDGAAGGGAPGVSGHGKSEAEGEVAATSSLNGAEHSVAQESRVFVQMERRASHVRSSVGPAGEGLFTLIGYTSDPTLAQRKPYLCLFINQRLVESSAVRKAVDGVYSGVLTGGNRPFTVLFVTVPTDRLDVNVHPTKKEVFLLDEELIVARVSEVCRGAVLEAAAARQMDMLKMKHTTALAIKQMPIADGAGGVDSDVSNLSGSSSQHILEKLRDQHRRGTPVASPLTSSSTATASPATSGGGSAVVVAPCTMVRVEPQRGALDRYFSQRLSAGGADVVPSPKTPGSATLVDARGLQQGQGLCTNEPPTSAATSVLMARDYNTGEGATGPARNSAESSTFGKRTQAAASVDETPSWDTVMASLHRTTAPMNAGVGDAGLEDLATSISAVGAVHTAQTQQVGAAASRAETRGEIVKCEKGEATNPSPHTTAAQIGLKRECEIEKRALPLVDADTDGDEEEDRMREFKRHRRDVYVRAEALQSECPTTIKMEKSSEAAFLNTGASVVQREEAKAEGRADSELPPADEANVPGVVEEDNVEAQQTMLRLGAVVHAAGVLRGEAAAAAARASTFAHVVSSSEDRDDDEGKATYGARSTGAVKEASSLVSVAEVEAPAVLSSVSIVVDSILANTSRSAASLTGQLTYVGAIDGRAFLAQVGTTLVWCDTMSLVRHVVFQRIFLRWGQPSLPAPSVVEFDVPLSLFDLLAAALAFDALHLQPPSTALLTLIEDCDQTASSTPVEGCEGGPPRRPSLTAVAVQRMGGMSARAWRQLLFQEESAAFANSELAQVPDRAKMPQPKQATRRYISRLARRLCRWRGLLKEYFFVDITADGFLLSVPHGLNRHWPPNLRALPLTVWRLAEAVPYPSLHTDAGGGRTLSEEGEVASTPHSTGATPLPTQTVVEAEADGVAQEVACFTAVARQLADTLYGLQAPPPPAVPASSHRPSSAAAAALDAGTTLCDAAADDSWRGELVQHGLFPCLKNTQLFRLPDQCLRDGTIQSMVSVESLYKVFERC